jgi:hypothetical protein
MLDDGDDLVDNVMMAAFEQYMMRGKNNENQLQMEQQLKEQHKNEAVRQLALGKEHKQELAMRKAEKRYWHIYQTFSKRIREEWLDIDDQSYNVVQAIAAIRSRLPMHTRLLKRFRQQHALQKQEWTLRGYGFSGSKILLRNEDREQEEMVQQQDAELALSHELIQHEKMMDGLRNLLANLAECHEALLRHLDEGTKHHLECFEFRDLGMEDCNDVGNGVEAIAITKSTPNGSYASFEKAAGLPGIMNELMAMLSMEIYRKQCLAYSILETVGDELIADDGAKGQKDQGAAAEDEIEWEDMCPQEVAKRCSKQWSRSCKAGCIDVVFLKGALDLLN